MSEAAGTRRSPRLSEAQYQHAVRTLRTYLWGRGLDADQLLDEFYRYRERLTPVGKAIWIDAMAPAFLGSKVGPFGGGGD